MIEKPDLPDQSILSRLQEDFGLRVRQLSFLPLGADLNTAVYRIIAVDGTNYFLKLRKGASPGAWGADSNIAQLSVLVPLFLHKQGIPEIIAPLETLDGQPWAALEPYKLILYPFIQGEDGYEFPLTEGQWQDFGAALRSIHSARVPPEIARLIPRDIFSPKGRESVRSFQAEIEHRIYPDPSASQMAAVMKGRRGEIDQLVRRAEVLGQSLRARSPEYVLCHSDIHPGNLLIGAPAGETRAAADPGVVYIVDWDTPIFAPKERDLMLIGGCATWNNSREEALFYLGYASNPGYAQTGIDPIALTYYRSERIIQDISEFCQQLLGSDEGDENREQSLEWFESIFSPGHELEIAQKTDEYLLGQE